ncbi:MAG TPA: Crp/Fnr family transcriptional regulator [Puia sp.]|nr:Crp/Fnr family transcriptional regulator [Puia sp.]
MQIADVARQFVSQYVTLTDEEFSFLVQKLVIRDFDKKELVTREGEIEQYLNFITTGLARKYFYKNKEEMVTQIAKEDELITSYDSFLSGEPSVYVVETIEPTSFVSITRADVEELYASNPKMERLGRLITTQQFLSQQRWEYDRMRLDSHERFIYFIKDNIDLLRRVPQKYLASYLNITPETFSRFKHLLKNYK